MNLEMARALAIDLMQKYGIASEYSFKFDNSKRRFGQFNY